MRYRDLNLEENEKRADSTTPSAKQKEGKRYLILMGFSEYKESGFNNLPNAVKDIEDVKNLLERDFLFDRVIKLIGDGKQLKRWGKMPDEDSENPEEQKNENPTSVVALEEDKEKSEIIKIISKLADIPKSESDFIMLYFAGHGMVEGADGYWVPSTGKSSMFDYYCIAVSVVVSILSKSKATSFIVADCCHSGVATNVANWKSVYDGIVLGKTHPIYVLTSGRSQDKVLDGEPGTNSPFAAGFMRVLKDAPSEINFGWLTTKLSEVSGIKITNKAPEDLGFQGFPLIKKNPIAVMLGEALPDLNFDDQHTYFRQYIPKQVNLIYLKGTKKCGHQLFLHRFFELLCEDTSITFFEKPGLVETFRSSEYQASVYDQMTNFEQSIFSHIKKSDDENDSAAHRIYLILDEKSNSESFYQEFKNLWIKFTANYNSPENVYFFVLDKRGEDCVYTFVENDFKTENEKVSLGIFPDIKLLNKKNLEVWHARKKAVIKLQEFQEFPFDKFETPLPIESAISKICEYYDSTETLEIFFSERWK